MCVPLLSDLVFLDGPCFLVWALLKSFFWFSFHFSVICKISLSERFGQLFLQLLHVKKAVLICYLYSTSPLTLILLATVQLVI